MFKLKEGYKEEYKSFKKRLHLINVLGDLEGGNNILPLLNTCCDEFKKFDLNSNDSFNVFISKKSNHNRNFIGFYISTKQPCRKDIWDKHMEYINKEGKYMCLPELCYNDYVIINVAPEETGKYLLQVAIINTNFEYKLISRHYKHLPNSDHETIMKHISKFITDNYSDIIDDLDVNWEIWDYVEWDDN